MCLPQGDQGDAIVILTDCIDKQRRRGEEHPAERQSY